MALKDGVVGRELVAYFEHFSKEAVGAETLRTDLNVPNVYDYRITFADGSVEDYRVTFSKEFEAHILSAEPIA